MNSEILYLSGIPSLMKAPPMKFMLDDYTHRAPMDHNRLYCHNMVSIYKMTKIIDYNPLKMD